MIIGAMKSGTTSLHSYLDLHPEIGMSRIKEPDFFVAERNWSKGLDWYSSLFPEGKRVLGEASTSYSKHPIYLGVPERIHSVVPGVKLIYLVRDPLERIVANELHWREFGGGPESFELALRDFVDVSRYHMQLSRYLKWFPSDRVLLLFSDDLKNDRRAILRRIFQFLGVDPEFDHPDYDVVHDNHELRLFLREAEQEKARRRGVTYVERVFGPSYVEEPPRSEIDAELMQAITRELADDRARLKTLASHEGWV